MDGLIKFLDINLNGRVAVGPSSKYRVGIAGTEILEEMDDTALDRVALARLSYIRNLALKAPMSFEVPEELDPCERALMRLSFGDYAGAEAALNLGIELEIIGAEARSRTGGSVSTLVAWLRGVESTELHDFANETLAFKDFRVESLNHSELIFLYIKLVEQLACEDNRSLMRAHATAIVERAFFEKNSIQPALRKALLLCRAELTNDVRELESLAGVPVALDGQFFRSPIVFSCSACAQIGRSLIATFDYGAAHDVLRHLPLFDEKIDCLIALRKSELAVAEIQGYIRCIGESDERSDRIVLSGLYTKLAHLCQDTRYFDLAAATFKSARPFQLKGLWLFKKERHAEAAEAFERALEITPGSEEIRFSYGCTLVELDRIAEALKIFRMLKSENAQSETISKNLSYCYYKLQDVDNSLQALRSVALHDHASMKQFLCISIKNDKMENVRWALERMNYDSIVHDAASYLIGSGKMGAEEIRSILARNTYFNDTQADEVCTMPSR